MLISLEKFNYKVSNDFNLFAIDKSKSINNWKIVTMNGKLIKAILLLKNKTIEEFYQIDGKNYFDNKNKAQKELNLIKKLL